MGTHVLKLNKGLLFAKKLANIYVLRSAATQLALEPVSGYNCHVKLSCINFCAKFH